MQQMKIKLIVVCSFIVFSAQGLADRIYQTTQKDGSVTYSDQPSENAVEVTLDSTITTIESKNAVQKNVHINNKPIADTHKMKILSPAPDATIRDNLGNINIAASLEPALAGFFELTINEQAYTSPSGVFSLSNMDRGTYRYTVKFIDNSGKVIASTTPYTLHLHKASALIN